MAFERPLCVLVPSQRDISCLDMARTALSLFMASIMSYSRGLPCQYYVLFSRQHSAADAACRLISAQKSINASCLGEVFAQGSANGKAIRSKQGVSIEQQRAEPGLFLRQHLSCDRRICGVVVMPNALPTAAVPRLFSAPHVCDMRILSVERSNRTAEYLLWRGTAKRSEIGRNGSSSSSSSSSSRGSSGGSGGGNNAAALTPERNSQLHSEWFDRVGKLAADAGTPHPVSYTHLTLPTKA